MKKTLLLLVLLMFAGSCFAVETTATTADTPKAIQKWNGFWAKIDKSTENIDAKITEQQKKYEEQKAIRDDRIQQKQKQREEIYNAKQKKLEEKREQLRKLLEE